MKVQELFPGSKSSPARAGKSAASEGRGGDFADALIDARRKPEPKRAEAPAPAAKNPSAKKSKPSKDQAEPSEDAPATDELLPAVAKETVPASQQAAEKSVATDELPVDESAEETSSELPKTDADLSAILAAQVALPNAPSDVAVTDAEGVDASEPEAVAFCPPDKRKPPVVATPVNATADAGADETGVNRESADVAAMLLDQIEEVGDLELPPDVVVDDGDVAEPVARTPVPSTKSGATPALFEIEHDAPEADAVPDDDAAPAALPAIASAFSMDDQALSMADQGGPQPVAPPGPDADVAPALTQQQPDAPRTERAPAGQSAPAPVPPQAHFVEANHPKIVTAVRGELLPHGGSMQIRLDPPELGALLVSVHMQDGVMTASFHTTNDDATKLLSHSLSQLKQVLESQGVSVEKLQVQQSPRDQQSGNDDPRQQPRDPQDDAARQEQQRKEMLRRMWRRLSMGSDPLDLVA
ncbi:MAG: flagellar hook-length control protein FliK [Tepidisphaeraceae bacterium]